MKIKKKKCFFILLFILNLFIISPAIANIIVSIKPVGFITSAIVDGIIPVEVILPYGVSEHNYFLKPSDLKKIKNSDLLIWIDPELETFLKKSEYFVNPKNNLVLSSIEKIKEFIIYSDNKNDFYKNKNMHFWLSPKIAKIFALSIYEKIIKIIPQKKEFLLNNLKNFEKKLLELDKKIFHKLQNVKEKKYLVFHDAFVYFEKYYGLSPAGFITFNPLIQPGIKKLNQIKKQIIDEKNIVCIFSEPQYQNNLVKKIFYQNNIKQGVLDPLGSDINLNKNSYLKFLLQLANQYLKCLR